MINKKNKRTLITICIALLIIIIAIIYFFDDIKKININSIENYIKSYGSWSILAYLIISAIRPLGVIIPITLLTLIAGSLYGPFYGFILSMLSITISSNVAFLISRYLGKSFLERIIKKRAHGLNLKIEKNGFKIMFLIRISSIFPLDIVSYAAGMTNVRYTDFILGTIFGSMIETFSVAYMGHNIKNPLSPGFLLSLVLVIVTIGVPLIYNKFKGKKNKN